jgi:hypothetical protein
MAERALGGHGGPTGDLYFANACGDALTSGQVRRLSPTVFASDQAVLVLRHGAGLDIAAAARGKRLIWLIDDDIRAGIADPALRPVQRLKLALCERAFARHFRDRLDTVVLSTPALEAMVRDLVPGAGIEVLTPYWSEPLPDLGHLEGPPERVDIACLGAATHRADLALVWPGFENLLTHRPQVRVWISANHRPPRALAGHERLCVLPETSWTSYRAALTQRRFHILAYPLHDTGFNRARSVNKIIEHALLGGAGVYAACWPEAARIEAAGAGLLAGQDPADWTEALEQMTADILAGGTRARALAEAGQALAARLNQPGSQRQVWSRLMELDLA